MKPQIITVSSHRPKEPYYCYDQFYGSCRRFGYEPITLGQHGGYKGLGSKPKLLWNYLLENSTHGPLIVCDCWDVILLSHPESIIEEWSSRSDGGVLFNTERNCFPLSHLMEQFPKVATPYRYLNSGFFVGDADAIICMLSSMRLGQRVEDFKKPDGSWHHENDQEYYQEAFFDGANPVPMYLDSECRICQTLHGEDVGDFLFDSSGERPMNLLTHTQPMAYHANGGGKTGNVMPKVLEYYERTRKT